MTTKTLKLRRETLRSLVPAQMMTVAGGRIAGYAELPAQGNEAPITTTYQSTVLTIGVAPSTAGPTWDCGYSKGCQNTDR